MQPVNQSTNSRMLAYPARGTVNWLFFRSPLLGWRMGFGFLLGRYVLVLTTTGRKTGLPRRTALSYTIFNDKWYLLAGWGERCQWYQNLLANPLVTFQTDLGSASAEARLVAEPLEFRQVFQRMLDSSKDPFLVPWLESFGIRPDPEDMFRQRSKLHLVALERSELTGPPALEADLVWLWPLLALVFTSGWLLGRRARRPR